MRRSRTWAMIMIGVGMIGLLNGCSGSGTESRTSSTENAIEAAINARDNEESGTGDSQENDVGLTDEAQGTTGNDDSGNVSENTADEGDSSAILEDTTSNADGIDVDLTTLSSTMVYSEVYNMMAVPDDYIGKTIKMAGAYTYFKDETTGKQYYACVIQDATACCAQGIEFIPTSDYVYPDDYPQEGEDVTVVGTFSLYEENGFQYATLLDAKMI